MRPFLTISKALSDPTRLRIIMALREGELCLCQLIEFLGLAPSTVSKHVNLLTDAGLVTRRKEGRWAYFRLAGGRTAAPAVKQALRWVTTNLEGDETIRADIPVIKRVMASDLDSLCACYQS